MLGGKLHRIEDAQNFFEVASRRHRISQHQLNLFVGADDKHRAHRLVGRGGAAFDVPVSSAGNIL